MSVFEASGIGAGLISVNRVHCWWCGVQPRVAVYGQPIGLCALPGNSRWRNPRTGGAGPGVMQSCAGWKALSRPAVTGRLPAQGALSGLSRTRTSGLRGRGRPAHNRCRAERLPQGRRRGIRLGTRTGVVPAPVGRRPGPSAIGTPAALPWAATTPGSLPARQGGQPGAVTRPVAADDHAAPCP